MTKVVIDNFCSTIKNIKREECEKLVGELLSPDIKNMKDYMKVLNKISKTLGKSPEEISEAIMKSCPLCD
jgi:hypothetical protein